MEIKVLMWAMWNPANNSFDVSKWHDPAKLPSCGKCYWVTIPIPVGDIPELTAQAVEA